MFVLFDNLNAYSFSCLCFQYVIQFTEDLSELLFERFMTHMVKCAAANRSLTAREARRIHLTNLFLSCDHSGVS